jgi:hypothetical protein
MSAATAPAARTGRAGSPARAPGAARHPAPRPTPRLRAVPAPAARRPLAPFLLVTVGLAVAGLVGLLLLNTLVAQDSFRLSALQRDNRALAEREQVLVARVSALDAPRWAGAPGREARHGAQRRTGVPRPPHRPVDGQGDQGARAGPAGSGDGEAGQAGSRTGQDSEAGVGAGHSGREAEGGSAAEGRDRHQDRAEGTRQADAAGRR